MFVSLPVTCSCRLPQRHHRSSRAGPSQPPACHPSAPDSAAPNAVRGDCCSHCLSLIASACLCLCPLLAVTCICLPQLSLLLVSACIYLLLLAVAFHCCYCLPLNPDAHFMPCRFLSLRLLNAACCCMPLLAAACLLLPGAACPC